MPPSRDKCDWLALTRQIKRWGSDLGLDAVGIADTDLTQAEQRLERWLRDGHQGKMDFMVRHGSKRSRPAELQAGTLRVISARLGYLPHPQALSQALLREPQQAFIARYALGRDYHKLLRRRLQRLAEKIRGEVGAGAYRVYVDSAPVMEKPLAQKAGLGWIGKHTNLIAREAGSWFFLGEIYTDLPLPPDTPARDHCGSCRACIEVCPTRAIVAPYRLDARRCIAYLTIEHPGSIPAEFRSAIGNRIFGCDDCQLVCPWNRFARITRESGFLPREPLDRATLLQLFAWSETEFLVRTEGSAIRRLGHARWRRNIAVALGNGAASREVIATLKNHAEDPSALVREHVAWALHRLSDPSPSPEALPETSQSPAQ